MPGEFALTHKPRRSSAWATILRASLILLAAHECEAFSPCRAVTGSWNNAGRCNTQAKCESRWPTMSTDSETQPQSGTRQTGKSKRLIQTVTLRRAASPLSELTTGTKKHKMKKSLLADARKAIATGPKAQLCLTDHQNLRREAIEKCFCGSRF
jgi:hypothetical protein